jgi:hypothetical protein
LYATGFDAMTGALSRIDITGRGGMLLDDAWKVEGPVSYLGLEVAGFPNLFIITGPGSPSALSNIVCSLEQEIDWIGDCLVYLQDHGHRAIEARPDAQAAWVEHANSLVAGSIALHPTCHSWWNGSNVPGKKRVYMAYAGGLPEYHRRCDEVSAAGYVGFDLC